MDDDLKVSDWIERFSGVSEAAAALGVDRVTLWRWSVNGDRFPGGWGYKAKAIRRKPRQTSQVNAQTTIRTEQG